MYSSFFAQDSAETPQSCLEVVFFSSSANCERSVSLILRELTSSCVLRLPTQATDTFFGPKRPGPSSAARLLRS